MTESTETDLGSQVAAGVFPALLEDLEQTIAAATTEVERERAQVKWALIAGRWCDDCIAAQVPEPEGVRDRALEILARAQGL